MKKHLGSIIYFLLIFAVCVGVSADAMTRLYYPDGSHKMVGTSMVLAETAGGATFSQEKQKVTLYDLGGQTITVYKAETEEKKAQGWYIEPVRKVYNPDGQNIVILTRETNDYMNTGWYLYPVSRVYAADGRTLVIKTEELDTYLAADWYKEPVMTLYKPDGSTQVAKKSELDQHLQNGWFADPVTYVYTLDGRSLVVKQTDVDGYIKNGWYKEPHIIVYAKDGNAKIIKKSELLAYQKDGWALHHPESAEASDASAPMVALTFDDGPSLVTNRILDCLNQYGAKATFFVVGKNVKARPEIVKRAYNSGMEIGNHTMSHPNLKTLGAESITAQLSGASDVIYSAIGTRPLLLRPPYGNYNKTVSDVCGMPMILWSIDTLDWKTRNAESTVNAVLSEVKDGSVILMHDLYDATAAATEQIVPALIERGYRLVTVSELARAKGCTMTTGQAYRSFPLR